MAMDMTTALTIKANVVGQSQIGGLSNGLRKVTGETNKTATAMGRLRTAAGGALGAMRTLLPALGVAGIAAFAKSNLDAADSMSKLSQRTGIAAPTLDRFRKVAELSDTSIQSLEKAFPALARGIDDAIVKGTGPAAEAFSRLGVGLTDANGKARETDAVMLDLADKFQQLPDGTEKAALASQIFGQRLGSELIPLLNSGGDAVRNMGTALTQEFADKAAAFNDRLEVMQEKLVDMGIKITEALLPAIEAILPMIEGLVSAFASLPGPVQGFIVAVGGIAALAAVFSPLITIITTIGPAFSGLIAAVAPVIATIKTLGAVLAGVFSGPVGWIALLAGAGVALYAFRDEIGAVFSNIGELFAPALQAFQSVFVDPFIEAGRGVIDWFSNNWIKIVDIVTEPFSKAIDFLNSTFIQPINDAISSTVQSIQDNWSALQYGLVSPFEAAGNVIKSVMNNVLGFVESAINNAISAINGIISAVNAVSAAAGIPPIPNIPNVSIPRFAKGGMVNGAQLAIVGEAGPEYIVPARKAEGFAQNIMAGVRGPGAIPRFAEGGYVSPSANVSIQTGPVTQMNGQNYVTMQDMQKAVKSGVNETLNLIQRDIGVRGRLGLA